MPRHNPLAVLHKFLRNPFIKDKMTTSGDITYGDESDKKYLLSDTTDIDLLIIGKTLHGKSALGNSILRRNAFVSRNYQACPGNMSYEFGEFNGRVIKVVDGPGFGDYGINTEKGTNLALEGMRYVVTANPSGYHACLLVFKYGGRFTEDDQEKIFFLKEIFGENFVKNYCILVLNCGDDFDDEDSFFTFQEWCAEQRGVFAEIVKECEKRVVLFDNRTIDESKQMAQLSELMKMVDSLSTSGSRYKNEDFIREHDARIKLLLGGYIEVKEEYLKDIGLICNVLKNVDCKDNPTDHIEKLNKLLKNTIILFDNITQLEKISGIDRECAEVIIEIVERIELAQDAQQEEKELEKQRLAFEKEEKAQREKVANLNARLERHTNEIKELKEELHSRGENLVKLNNEYHQEKEAHENDLQNLRQTHDLEIQQLTADNTEKAFRYTALQNEQRLIIARQKEDIDKLHNMMAKLNNEYQQEKEAHESDMQNLRQTHDLQIPQLKADDAEKESRNIALQNDRLKKPVESEKKKPKSAEEREDEIKKKIDPLCRQCKYSTNSGSERGFNECLSGNPDTLTQHLTITSRNAESVSQERPASNRGEELNYQLDDCSGVNRYHIPSILVVSHGDQQYRMIQSYFCTLKENIRAEEFTDKMHQEGILSIEEKQDIDQMHGINKRKDALFDAIHRHRNKGSVDVFLEILKEIYTPIYESWKCVYEQRYESITSPVTTEEKLKPLPWKE